MSPGISCWSEPPTSPRKADRGPIDPHSRRPLFVTHDDRFLYIAFFCQDDHLADRVIARDNFVHYDELWPVGDDLVEVVIDPTAKAASPATCSISW